MTRVGRLMSTTALLLAAGMSLASAQGVSREPNAPAATPNAQTPSPPKAGAPQGRDQSMPQNRGTDPRGTEERSPRQANPKGKDRDQTTGQGTPSQNPPGESKRDPGADPKGQKTQPNERGQQNQGTQQRGRQDQENRGTQRNQDQQNQGAQRGDRDQQNQGAQRGQQPTDQTQGQGSHANISTEQRTRVRETIVKESNAPRVTNVTFNISVGTVVPRTVRLAPVPVTIIEVVPAWRGYVYFIVGDDIIVVEPGTHRIVAVIAA